MLEFPIFLCRLKAALSYYRVFSQHKLDNSRTSNQLNESARINRFQHFFLRNWYQLPAIEDTKFVGNIVHSLKVASHVSRVEDMWLKSCQGGMCDTSASVHLPWQLRAFTRFDEENDRVSVI